MTDKKPRWSTDEKVCIVLQTLNPQGVCAFITIVGLVVCI